VERAESRVPRTEPERGPEQPDVSAFLGRPPAAPACLADKCPVAERAGLRERKQKNWVLFLARRREPGPAPLADWQRAELEAGQLLAYAGSPIPRSEIIRSLPATAESVALDHRVAGLRTSCRRSRDFTLVIDHSRKAQSERRALSRLAGKVDCTIVQLHHSKCGGKSNACAGFFGCEV
jgi:hypothetical protein